MLIALDPTLVSLPPNFSISSQSIDCDFADCLWAIYRGSGSAIRAAMSGLRPIYFNDTSLGLSIDALYMLHTWRREISAVDTLSTIFNTDLCPSSDSFCSEYASVRKSLFTLLSPYYPNSFLKYI